jgi:hypothetical protein
LVPTEDIATVIWMIEDETYTDPLKLTNRGDRLGWFSQPDQLAISKGRLTLDLFTTIGKGEERSEYANSNVCRKDQFQKFIDYTYINGLI